MKVIIIEDEKLSADYLVELLNRLNKSIKIEAIYDSVKQSVKAFSNEINADLIFVDIHLADGISFDIFEKVQVDTPVIFTTAYDEYALKAFKLNSVDYLLKPLGLTELKTAIEKFEKNSKGFLQNKINIVADSYQAFHKQFKQRFMVKMGENLVSVKSGEINHFIAEDGIVILTTLAGKRFPIDYTLDEIEHCTDPAEFFRINRKVIIKMTSIKKISTYFNARLKLNSEFLSEEDSIVSRERVGDFKQWLDR